MLQQKSVAWIKASVLSSGIAISQAVIDNYGPPFLEKRRAYGNQDPLSFRHVAVPQEFWILPDRLIVAVNINPDSPWVLDLLNGQYCIRHGSDVVTQVDFPHRPAFYDALMSTGQKVSQIVTLYGGGALGIFAHGDCVFARPGLQCHFCSLTQNRRKGTDFVQVVTESQIMEALLMAIEDATGVSQVMINGGTLRDPDESFQYYIRLAARAREAINRTGRDVELHVIACPPRDLHHLEQMRGLDMRLAINLEVFDGRLFEEFCPGKSKAVGRDHILAALRRAVDINGRGRVFSIFVGGLEPLGSLRSGLRYLAEMGVTPVINVLHTDPETPLEDYPNPSVQYIMEAGHLLQDCYADYHLRPFYDGCGRNSIDTEAYCRLFT